DTNHSQANNIAERVRAAIAETPFVVGDGLKIKVTVSVGVALNEGYGDTPETLLKRADVALYRAKEMGRNQVVFDAA
ncbi:MAG TPA: diguanylate cyclase, partial [Devosia sp.]|nr:diguanylate cyclase [Devosia sp.]